jgi:xylitol oxidase
LASLTELSIAGAFSTAVHGSGNNNRNLATSVCALEMVTGNGEIVKLSRDSDGDLFSGAVVGLGALGVITKLTLDIEPAFTVRQYVYEDLQLAQMRGCFHLTRVHVLIKGYKIWN